MKFFERACLNLGETWGIRLPDSERSLLQSLRAIEENKNSPLPCGGFFRDEHISRCNRMKEALQQTYRLRETSVAMLQVAKNSQDQTKWNNAYNAAEVADKATISYFRGPLHNAIMNRALLFIHTGGITFGIGIMAMNLDDFLLPLFSSLIFVLLGQIMSEIILYCNSERITSKFIPHLTQDVLHAACQEDIDIGSQHALETEIEDLESNSIPLLV